VEGLRAKDMQQIQQALEQARKAPRQGNHQAAGRDKAGE
jgi:hypothetical protein